MLPALVNPASILTDGSFPLCDAPGRLHGDPPLPRAQGPPYLYCRDGEVPLSPRGHASNPHSNLHSVGDAHPIITCGCKTDWQMNCLAGQVSPRVNTTLWSLC